MNFTLFFQFSGDNLFATNNIINDLTFEKFKNHNILHIKCSLDEDTNTKSDALDIIHDRNIYLTNKIPEYDNNKY